MSLPFRFAAGLAASILLVWACILPFVVAAGPPYPAQLVTSLTVAASIVVGSASLLGILMAFGMMWVWVFKERA